MRLLEAHAMAHHFDYPLFFDVSVSLDAHESIAIVGVSGSGKSTLLHVLASLLHPAQGSVSIQGRDVYSLNAGELTALRRDTLGLIFQQHYLFKGFSARENLEVAALLSAKEIDTELLERLGIAHVIMQKVTELSGGQQQRVSIARVLTKRPRIIFADEPTGNLDAQTSQEVMDLFESYIASEDAGLLLVTHEMAIAMRCTRVYRLENQVLVRLK